jgi:hypothetical protein
MAQDRPTASELLAAIADLLREEVTPVLDKADPRLGCCWAATARSTSSTESLPANCAPAIATKGTRR